ALLLLILAGCAGQGELVSVQNDMAKLQREMNQRLEKIEADFQGIRQELARTVATFDELQRQSQSLLGEAEENKRLALTKSREAEFVKDLTESKFAQFDKRVERIEKQLNISTQPTPERPLQPPGQTPSASVESGRGDSTLPDTERELFDAAFQRYRNGQNKEAIAAFDRFLKQFSRSPLSEDAQYWLAAAYYDEEDYEKAIVAFEELNAKYPKSKRVPTALYKQALAFYALRSKNKDYTNFAKDRLKKVVDTYPTSPEARLARNRLQEIK
ncbi:MAG: tol-pal system protein YbgF, partial [Candidatus Tectomicrobia bacterium]|nr:tol-pal system protein YbgF [Candidatus Tectomicrobia bacterium]